MRGLFAVVAAIGLFSLGMQPVSAEETMRYGVQPAMSPVYIALALGLFYPVERKDHVRFLFVPYQNGPAANKAIASGDLQMSSEDMGSALVAVSRLPATLVATDVFGQTDNGEIVSNDFLARHPAMVRDIVKALAQASDFIIKNPNTAAKLWARQIGRPEDVILLSLTKHISVYSRDIVPSKARIDANIKTLRRAKVLNARDVPKVDPSFALEALKAHS
jgi:ABC-type nitrate/sulfonate/bicarbonate transport system substrate-binding protein